MWHSHSYKFLAITREKKKGLCGEHRKVARRKKLPIPFWHGMCRPPRAKSKVKLFYFLKKLSNDVKKVL